MGLLAEIRDEQRELDSHLHKRHRKHVEIHELREDRERAHHLLARLHENRREIRDEIEAEVKADEVDAGERGEAWEVRKEARRDELADRIEVVEHQLDVIAVQIDNRRDRIDELGDLILADRDRIDRLRERRRRRHEDHAGQLTEHFHVEEFRCRDGTPVPQAAVEALRDNCRRYLEPARARFGALAITSGYRTRSYNASIGGASNSVHIYDAHPAATAADHVSPGDAAGSIQHFHDAETHPDGMGYYPGFTHVDNRNRIGWPDARWTGAG